MVNYNLIAEIGIDRQEADRLVHEALGEQVATGDMDGLLQKDIDLYRDAQVDAETENRVSEAVVEAFRRFADSAPDADISRIYPFVRDGKA